MVDLSYSECGIVIGVRQAALNIPEIVDLLDFSSMTISRVYREQCEKQETSSEQQFSG